MEKQYLQAKLKKSGDKIEFVASDETLDRHGDVLSLESWDLANYKKNPVLLVNHDYRVENIVGKAKNIRVTNGKESKSRALVFEPIFHGITELAKAVKQMVEDGFLDTVSVGFIPHGPKKDGDKESFELLEISFVPVPANPGASRLSIAAFEELAVKATDDEKLKVKEFTDEKVEEVEIIKSKEQFKERKDKDSETVLCDIHFIETLAEDSEKLQTLTDSSKGKAKKGRAGGSDLNVRVLQRLAKEINGALYQAKRK